MPRFSASEHNVLSELKWVHGRLRQELQVCRELASAVEAGAGAAEVRARMERLQSRSPLFQLKVNCLQACQFVHQHHGLEGVTLFPAVRRADPSLNRVVDRLESDHAAVSGLADELVAAADALTPGKETESERRRVIAALAALTDFLLGHLAYEETALAPLLKQWRQLPY